MSGRRLRIAYLSSDPGIAMEGTKGASVHFREMARALKISEGAAKAHFRRGLEALRRKLAQLRPNREGI